MGDKLLSLRPHASTTDPHAQHRTNAGKEKHFIADAAWDAQNLNREGSTLWAQGKRIEAQFDFEEARNAQSWVSKR
jgi:hypothetical protein